jgi:predicted ABC-type ATPase
VVRRRFDSGLRNLLEIYMDAVDSWQVYDNSDVGGPRLIASGASGGSPEIADPGLWAALEEQRK